MIKSQLPLNAAPIQFGTDGWRGVLGVDITIERLLPVAAAAAQELSYRAPANLRSRTVIIGFDRRFLAPELAEAIAAAVRGCDLIPLLTETSVPTPACSWAVVQRQALGALVITASHNPPEWLGLKIKGPFGGSVEGDFTKAVEKRLLAGGITKPISGNTERFDGRKEHLDGLRMKFDMNSLIRGLLDLDLKVFVDPMHGSAAGCLAELLGSGSNGIVEEIRSNRDPLFGGNPPEPLACYVSELISKVKAASSSGKRSLGIVFDGDGDRIAAVDESGRFCSTQLLMPLLIDHLVRVRKLKGSVVKTVSGSDLMRFVAEDLGQDVIELPVGFKYIAAKMRSGNVVVGGEESGGIGFGIHLPERDALFTALLVLEAIQKSSSSLGQILNKLDNRFGVSFYERIDIRLDSIHVRQYLEDLLASGMPSLIAGYEVLDIKKMDGVKFRFGKSHWLMLRFSGTEPLLRIYCEAPDKDTLNRTLDWAKDFAVKL